MLYKFSPNLFKRNRAVYIIILNSHFYILCLKFEIQKTVLFCLHERSMFYLAFLCALHGRKRDRQDYCYLNNIQNGQTVSYLKIKYMLRRSRKLSEASRFVKCYQAVINNLQRNLVYILLKGCMTFMPLCTCTGL